MKPSYDRTKVHTQSSLKQFKRCPFNYMRTYIDGVQAPTTPAIELGTAYHKAMERYINGDSWPLATDATLDDYPTHTVELLDLFARTEADWGNPPELSLGDQHHTERAAFYDGHAGTIDILAYHNNGTHAEITDWKTGQLRPDAPLGDFQMMFYGWLIVSNCRLMDDSLETVNLIIYNPRYGKQESGPIAAEAFELFYKEEVEPLVELIGISKECAKRPNFSATPWPQTQNEFCGSCHVRHECKFYKEAGDALVDNLSADPGNALAAPTNFPTTLTCQGDALRFLQLLPLAERWIKDRKAEVRTIVERDGPITDEVRGVYDIHPNQKYTVDVLTAAAIIKAEGMSPADLLGAWKLSRNQLMDAFPGKENKTLRDALMGAVATEPGPGKMEWRKEK